MNISNYVLNFSCYNMKNLIFVSSVFAVRLRTKDHVVPENRSKVNDTKTPLIFIGGMGSSCGSDYYKNEVELIQNLT